MREVRTRDANFTPIEENLLLRLVLKYKDTIANKKTDSVTCKEKKEAWVQIEREFSMAGFVRSAKSLKEKYENLKRAEKRKRAFEKDNLLQTGSPSTSESNSALNTLIDIDCTSILKLEPECDSFMEPETYINDGKNSEGEIEEPLHINETQPFEEESDSELDAVEDVGFVQDNQNNGVALKNTWDHCNPYNLPKTLNSKLTTTSSRNSRSQYQELYYKSLTEMSKIKHALEMKIMKEKHEWEKELFELKIQKLKHDLYNNSGSHCEGTT